MKLFEDELTENTEPKDDTQITTTILYFSSEEQKQFYAQCKAGMKKMFGTDAPTKGNMSDYLLAITKQNESN